MKEIEAGGIKKEVILEIIALAKKYGLTKVILFGSRARGDYHRASDIDLAVQNGNITGFSLEVEENTSTLLTFDVIDMNREYQKEFMESIQQEGKVLYEKI